MTVQEIDNLLDRAERALAKVQQLSRQAEQEINQRERRVDEIDKQQARDAKVPKINPTVRMATRAHDRQLQKEEDQLEHQVDELESAKDRMNRERGQLEQSLRELREAKRLIQDGIRRAETWNSNIASIVARVESEHL